MVAADAGERSEAPWAFISLLHGNKDEFFVYALVLANRLRRVADGAARVLLLGPGDIRDSSVHREALRNAGWTRLVDVEAIEAAHLDKTSSKRHRLVFTKLRALEQPYERVVLLDLDILPRETSKLLRLFEIPAPAGKYHGRSNITLRHGELLPEEATRHYWCPNAGVLRLDPKPTAEERRQEVLNMVKDVEHSRGTEVPTYLPEQYYLAEKLDNWRHIGYEYNHEVSIGLERYGKWAKKKVKDTQVWHYSGKAGLQPWMFSDMSKPEQVEHWLRRFYNSYDPEATCAVAFAEWTKGLQSLLSVKGMRSSTAVTSALKLLKEKSPLERHYMDVARVQHIAWSWVWSTPIYKEKRRPKTTYRAYSFPDYVAYYRQRHYFRPGPAGDDGAWERAQIAWKDAVVDEYCDA